MCTEIWTQYGRLKVCLKQTKLRWLMRQVAPQHLRGQYHYDTCTSGSNKQTQKQQVNKTKQRNCAWNEKTNNIFALPWITSSYHSCKHVANILQLLLVKSSSKCVLVQKTIEGRWCMAGVAAQRYKLYMMLKCTTTDNTPFSHHKGNFQNGKTFRNGNISGIYRPC